MRIHVFLSKAGIASRRRSEQLVSDGVVTVNGARANIGQSINPQSDVIKVSGQLVKLAARDLYYLLNKPPGFVSTNSDELGRSVIKDLIPGLSQYAFPVGRLDLASEGLILLTNDGQLADMLTHPKYKIPKTYHVLVSRRPSPRELAALKKGVRVQGETVRAQAIQIINSDSESIWLEIILTQGLNRQIRRMIKAINLEVIRLVRVSLGPWHIKQLKGQKYITLTHDAIYQDLRNFSKNISRDAQSA